MPSRPSGGAGRAGVGDVDNRNAGGPDLSHHPLTDGVVGLVQVAARQKLNAAGTLVTRRPVQVQAAHDPLFDARRKRGLRRGLVVERHVVEAVLRLRAVHTCDAVTHEDADLVRECGVVRTTARRRRREQEALPVAVLQTLTDQRRATRSRAHQESPAPHVAECPDEVTDALEPEHRVEDEERDHRLAPGGVRRPSSDERGHGPRFGYPLHEDAPVLSLPVREEEPRVDRLVLLPERRVDLHVAEECVDAEGARLVGNDRHDQSSPLRLFEQLSKQPRESHRRRRPDLLPRAGSHPRSEVGARAHGLRDPLDAFWEKPVEGTPSFLQVLALR